MLGEYWLGNVYMGIDFFARQAGVLFLLSHPVQACSGKLLAHLVWFLGHGHWIEVLTYYLEYPSTYSPTERFFTATKWIYSGI